MIFAGFPPTTVLGSTFLVTTAPAAKLARVFGATTQPDHRALHDARATVDVLHGLLARVADMGARNRSGKSFLSVDDGLQLLPPAVVVILMQKWFVKGLVDAEK